MTSGIAAITPPAAISPHCWTSGLDTSPLSPTARVVLLRVGQHDLGDRQLVEGGLEADEEHHDQDRHRQPHDQPEEDPDVPAPSIRADSSMSTGIVSK